MLKKSNRKLISLLLCVALMVTMIPTNILADLAETTMPEISMDNTDGTSGDGLLDDNISKPSVGEDENGTNSTPEIDGSQDPNEEPSQDADEGGTTEVIPPQPEGDIDINNPVIGDGSDILPEDPNLPVDGEMAPPTLGALPPLQISSNLVTIELDPSNEYFKEESFFDIAKYGTTEFLLNVNFEAEDVTSRAVDVTIPSGFTLKVTPSTSDINGSKKITKINMTNGDTLLKIEYNDNGLIAGNFNLSIAQNISKLGKELTVGTEYNFKVELLAGTTGLTESSMTFTPTSQETDWEINIKNGVETIKDGSGNDIDIFKRTPYGAAGYGGAGGGEMSEYMFFEISKTQGIVTDKAPIIYLPAPTKDYYTTSKKILASFVPDADKSKSISLYQGPMQYDSSLQAFYVSLGSDMDMSSTTPITLSDGSIKTKAELLAGSGTITFTASVYLDANNILPDNAKDKDGNLIDIDEYLVRFENNMNFKKDSDGNDTTEKANAYIQYREMGKPKYDYAAIPKGLIVTNTGTDNKISITNRLEIDIKQDFKDSNYRYFYVNRPSKEPSYTYFTNVNIVYDFSYEYSPYEVGINVPGTLTAIYGNKDSSKTKPDEVLEKSATASGSVAQTILTEQDIAEGYYIKQIIIKKPRYFAESTTVPEANFWSGKMNVRGADINGNTLSPIHLNKITVELTADQISDTKEGVISTNLVKMQDTASVDKDVYTPKLVAEDATRRTFPYMVSTIKYPDTMTYANPYHKLSGPALTLVNEISSGYDNTKDFYYLGSDDRWYKEEIENITDFTKFLADDQYIKEILIPSRINSVSQGAGSSIRFTTNLSCSDIRPGFRGFDHLGEDQINQIKSNNPVNLALTTEFESFASMDTPLIDGSVALPDTWKTELPRKLGTANAPDVGKYPYEVTNKKSATIQLGDSTFNEKLKLADTDFNLAPSGIESKIIDVIPTAILSDPLMQYKDFIYDFGESSPEALALTKTIRTSQLKGYGRTNIKIYYKTNKTGEDYKVQWGPDYNNLKTIPKAELYKDSNPFWSVDSDSVAITTDISVYGLALDSDEYVTDIKVYVSPNEEYYTSSNTRQRVLPGVGLLTKGQYEINPITGKPFEEGTYATKATVSYKDIFYKDESPDKHIYSKTFEGKTPKLKLYPQMIIDSVTDTVEYENQPYQGGFLAVETKHSYKFSDSTNGFSSTAGTKPTKYYKIHPNYMYEPGSLVVGNESNPNGVQASFIKAKTTDGYGVLKVEFTEGYNSFFARNMSHLIKFKLRVLVDASPTSTIVPIPELWTDYSSDEERDSSIQKVTIAVANILERDTQGIKGPLDDMIYMVQRKNEIKSTILAASTLGISVVGKTPNEISSTVTNKNKENDDTAFGIYGSLVADPNRAISDWIMYIPVPKKGKRVMYDQVSDGNLAVSKNSEPSEFSLGLTKAFSIPELDRLGTAYTVAYSKEINPTLNKLPDNSGNQGTDVDYISDVASWIENDWAEVTMIRVEIPTINAKVKAIIDLDYKVIDKKSKLGIETSYGAMYTNFKREGAWYYPANNLSGKRMYSTDVITYRLDDFNINGKIWKDTNYNSLLDTAEANSGMVGKKVEVYEGNTLHSSYVTAGTGNYMLNVPSYGDYTIKGNLPEGYVMVNTKDAAGNQKNYSWFERNPVESTVNISQSDLTNINGGMAESPTLTGLPDEIRLVEGKTDTLIPIIGPSYYKPKVTYTTTNDKKVTVSNDKDTVNNGVVTGVSDGIAVVTVSIPDGFGGTITKDVLVIVGKNIPSTGVAKDLHLYVGKDNTDTSTMKNNADFTLITNSGVTAEQLTLKEMKRVTDQAPLSEGMNLKETHIGKYKAIYEYNGDGNTLAFTVERDVYVHGAPYLSTNGIDAAEEAHSRVHFDFDVFKTANGDIINGYYKEVDENGVVSEKDISNSNIQVILYSGITDQAYPSTVIEPGITGKYKMTYQIEMPKGGQVNVERNLYEHGNPLISQKAGTVWPSMAEETGTVDVNAKKSQLENAFKGVLTIVKGRPNYSLDHILGDGTIKTYTDTDIDNFLANGILSTDISAVNWNKTGLYPVKVEFKDSIDAGDGLDMLNLGLYDQQNDFGYHSITAYVQITGVGDPIINVPSGTAKIEDMTDTLVTKDSLFEGVTAKNSDGTDISLDEITIGKIVNKSQVDGSETVEYDGTGTLSDDKVSDIFSKPGHYEVSYQVTVGVGDNAKTVTVKRDIYVHGTPKFFEKGSMEEASKYDVVVEKTGKYKPDLPDVRMMSGKGATLNLAVSGEPTVGVDISTIENGVQTITYKVNTMAAVGIDKEYTFTKYIYINTPVKITGHQNTTNITEKDVNVFKGKDKFNVTYDVKANFTRSVVDKHNLGTFTKSAEELKVQATKDNGGNVITLNENDPIIVKVKYTAIHEVATPDENYKNIDKNQGEQTVDFTFVNGATINTENTIIPNKGDLAGEKVVTMPEGSNLQDVINKIAPKAEVTYPGDNIPTKIPPEDVITTGIFKDDPKGDYVIITATDKDGNETEEKVYVNYQKPPTINNVDTIITTEGETLTDEQLKDKVLENITVTDYGKDGNIGDKKDIVITYPNDTDWYKKHGSYEVELKYTDNLGQTVTEKRRVDVEGKVVWTAPDKSYYLEEIGAKDVIREDLKAEKNVIDETTGMTRPLLNITDKILVKDVKVYNPETSSYILVTESYMKNNNGHYQVTFEYINPKTGISEYYTKNVVITKLPELTAGNISIKTNTKIDQAQLLNILDAKAYSTQIKGDKLSSSIEKIEITEKIKVKSIGGTEVTDSTTTQDALNNIVAVDGTYEAILEVTESYTNSLGEEVSRTVQKIVNIIVDANANGVTVKGQQWNVVQGDTIADIWMGSSVTNTIGGTVSKEYTISKDEAGTNVISLETALKSKGLYYINYKVNAKTVGIDVNEKDVQELRVNGNIEIVGMNQLRLLESNTPFDLKKANYIGSYLPYNSETPVNVDIWTSIDFYPLKPGGQDIKFKADHILGLNSGITAGTGRTAEAILELYVDEKAEIKNLTGKNDLLADNSEYDVLTGVTASYGKSTRDNKGIYSLVDEDITTKVTTGIKTGTAILTDNKISSTKYGENLVTYTVDNGITYFNNLKNEVTGEAKFIYPTKITILWNSADENFGAVDNAGTTSALEGEKIASISKPIAKTGYEFSKWDMKIEGAKWSGATTSTDVNWPMTIIMPTATGSELVKITFTAYFKKMPGNVVKFQSGANGNIVDKTPTILEQYVLVGNKADIPGTNSDSGYTFKGWIEKGKPNQLLTTDYLKNLIVTKDVTYEAVFEKITGISYKIEYYAQNLNDSTYTIADTENKSGTANEVVEVDLNADSIKNKYYGYELKALQPENSGTVKEDGSTLLKVYYDRKSFTLSYDLAGGTGTIPATTSYQYETEVQTADAPIKSEYTFVGWKDDKNLLIVAKDNYKVQRDTLLTAQWIKTPSGGGSSGGGGGAGGGSAVIKYQIIAVANEGGTINPSGVVEVTKGSSKVFAIQTEKGYEISEIKVDGKIVDVTNFYTFKDVEENHTIEVKFKKAGMELITEDHFAYVGGYPDRSFKADQGITRAEAAVIFANLLGGNSSTSNLRFSDTDNNEWYASKVSKIVNLGIMGGYPDGSFRPYDKITRAEFSVIAAKFDKLNVPATLNLNDVNGHWAKEYIALAVNRGWVGGYPDNSFKPDNGITRAEVVTVVNNMLERYADNKFVDKSDEVRKFVDLNNSHWAYYNIIEAVNPHDYTREEDSKKEIWSNLK